VPPVAAEVAQRLVHVHDSPAVVDEDGLEGRLGEAAEAVLAVAELLLGLLAVRDVEEEAEQAVGADRGGVDEAVAERAVLPPNADLVAAGAEGEHPHQAVGELAVSLPGQKVGDRHADELVPAVAGEGAGRAVHLEVLPVVVRDEEGDG